MKNTLISLFLITVLGGCAAATHDTMQNIANKRNCSGIINPDERFSCQQNYKERYEQKRQKYEQSEERWND